MTAAARDAIDALLARARRAGVQRVSFAAVDWNGRLRATQVPLAGAASALVEGLAVTTAIFAPDSAERPITSGYFHDPAHGYRDAWLRPDAAAARSDPWADGGASLIVLGSLEGEFAGCCPRAMLEREVAALARLGLRCDSAFELEYHVLNETVASLREKVPARLDRLAALERMYSYVDQAVAAPLLDATRSAAAALEIPVHGLHAEFSGLLEVALGKASGVRAADDAALFKAVAKIVARRGGMLASFMARLAEPFESAGAHLNLSLHRCDGEVAEFHAPEGRCSPALLGFLGGLQRHLPDLMLLLLPHLNSYKRYLGDSFAPRTNSWGIDNKTCAYRLVNHHAGVARLECRVPGADVNPYLALTALLAAGRRGLEQALVPSAPVTGDAAAPDAPQAAPWPPDFAAAIAQWRRADFARETFGDLFVDAYARTREWELEQLAKTVTDWEIRQFAEGV
ncbi:MAG TPA: hypothetical protein PJ986_17455 [Gammaproteobacteria bacterium]|nr:hypothetical protein [Gammaproteobacteria bacterium]